MSTEELINSLLYEEESTTLDFKSEQYKFEKAEDREKAELLKDIVAFTNAWRRSDAYILIGIKEVKGERSEVKGIANDLDDAQLQQFVQSKINKPIHFSYITMEFEGEKVAMISIPVQSRPVFLKKDFANLKANTVYIRRGSSTAIALPDEIAKMGYSDQGEVKKSPKLRAFIAGGEHEEEQLEYAQRSVVVAKLPQKNEFPEYGIVQSPNSIAHLAASLPATSPFNANNKNFYSEFSEYLRQISSTFSLKIGIKNDGNLVSRDVRAVINFEGLPQGSVAFDESEVPIPPEEKTLSFTLDKLTRHSPRKKLNLKSTPNGHLASIDFGKIQAKDVLVCEERIHFRVTTSCKISANVTIFSDDLEMPEKLSLIIDVDAEVRHYSVEQVIKASRKYLQTGS